MSLNEYLSTAASTPFKWAGWDCCNYIADWCVARGNNDPMQRWRGIYDSEDGAKRLIEKAGGLLPLWMLGMIDAQIPEADEPKIGDVGVVEVLGENGPEHVGGIFGGKRWHMLAPNGLFQASVPLVQAWRVG